jgi:hypothetical protein
LVKEDEIDLGMGDCFNVAFKGDGRIAVVVGYSNQFVVLEVGRNETNPGQLIIKRKMNSGSGGSNLIGIAWLKENQFLVT